MSTITSDTALPVEQIIKAQLERDRVVLYMKGTPDFPQCGFSAEVVRLLKACNAEFASVNVLEDNAIREGIKQFANWPTIPQLYVEGEFIGGCDIVSELYEEGDLQVLLGGK